MGWGPRRPGGTAFNYLVDDLSHQRVDDLANRAMTALSRLVLICLARARPSDDILQELEEVRELLDEVLAAPDAVAAFAAILSYVLQATDVAPGRLSDFSRQLGPKAVEAYMTGAQQIEERGRKKGREEGRGELLLAMAERRFGPLSAGQRAKLKALAPQQTIHLAERILDATSFDDLFADGA